MPDSGELGRELGCCACTDCGGFENVATCFWDLNHRTDPYDSCCEESAHEAYLSADYYSAKENQSEEDEADGGERRSSISATDRLKQSLRGLQRPFRKKADSSALSPRVTDGEESARAVADALAQELIAEEAKQQQKQQQQQKQKQKQKSKKKFRKHKSSASIASDTHEAEHEAEVELTLEQRIAELEVRCSDLGNQRALAQEEVKKLQALLNKRQLQKRNETQRLEKDIAHFEELVKRRDEDIKKLYATIKSKEALVEAASQDDAAHIAEYQAQLEKAKEEKTLQEREHLHVRTALEERIRHLTTINMQLDHACRTIEAQKLQVLQHLSASQQQLMGRDMHIRNLQSKAQVLQRTISTGSVSKASAAGSDDGSVSSRMSSSKPPFAIRDQLARTADKLRSSVSSRAVSIPSAWDGRGLPSDFHISRAVVMLLPLVIASLQLAAPTSVLVLVGYTAWNAYLQSPISLTEFGFVLCNQEKEDSAFQALSSAVVSVLKDRKVQHLLTLINRIVAAESLWSNSAQDRYSMDELKQQVHECEASGEVDESAAHRIIKLAPTGSGWQVMVGHKSLLTLTSASGDQAKRIEYGHRECPLSAVLPTRLVLHIPHNVDPPINVASVSTLQRQLVEGLTHPPWHAQEASALLRHLTMEAAHSAIGFQSHIASEENKLGWDSLLAKYDPSWLALVIQTRRLYDTLFQGTGSPEVPNDGADTPPAQAQAAADQSGSKAKPSNPQESFC